MTSYDLKQEHQSKALLIKFTWIMLAGMCLLSISAMRWDVNIRPAHLFGKVGVDLWLSAGLALIAAGNAWIKDDFVAMKISLALLCPPGLWFALATIRLFASSNMAAIDMAFALLAVLYLLPAAVGWQRASVQGFAKMAGIAWFLSALSLFVASILWACQDWFGSQWLAWITTLLLSLLTTLPAWFCLRALRFLGEHQAPSSDNEAVSSEDAVVYVTRRTNLVASVVMIYTVAALLGVMKFRDALAGPTIVMSLIAFVSALMTLRIRIAPKFEDLLRVFSSTMGTQFIYPTEILLTDQLVSEIERMAENARNLKLENDRDVT